MSWMNIRRGGVISNALLAAIELVVLVAIVVLLGRKGNNDN